MMQIIGSHKEFHCRLCGRHWPVVNLVNQSTPKIDESVFQRSRMMIVCDACAILAIHASRRVVVMASLIRDCQNLVQDFFNHWFNKDFQLEAQHVAPLEVIRDILKQMGDNASQFHELKLSDNPDSKQN